MPIICTKCNVAFSIIKNGVTVLSTCGPDSTGPRRPYQLWDTDKWGCPGCGAEVCFIDWRQKPLGEHWQERFQAQVQFFKEQGNKEGHPIVHWHERLEEKRAQCASCGRDIIRELRGDVLMQWVHVNGGHFCVNAQANATDYLADPEHVVRVTNPKIKPFELIPPSS